ncbi:MgtC/SapB family protein [Edaphobacter aggregans]|uniref:MgtC/SapB family protein n=1 Tax=Edaphobacter aggregans TaxID=570835 RepID=UPI00055205A2|nr:MgtC/SapB family protein [Edaphobacter aggregans]
MIQSGNGILGIAIAALGGAAVGVDRQRAYRENEPGAIGGLRTFTLLGTVAGVCGFLIANALITLGVVILASTAAMVLIVRLGAGRIPRDATTEVAAMAVLVSGVTAGLGHLGIAAALYAWTLLLLIEKSWLHALVNRIGLIELEAAAQFAAMGLIVLPLLPSGDFGPRGILNLRSLWTLVLVFSGISFAGYLARKAMGAKIGWVLTGLIGGLISSTQVALSFSRDSRSHPESYVPLSGGVMAATSVSMLRVCILCLLLRPALAIATFFYVIAPLSIGVLFTVYSLRRPSSERASLEEKNPLRVLTAAYLALIFIAAQYLVTFARAWFGNAGMFGSAGLLGSVDIDALVASLAPMVRRGMETSEAARVIAVGILGNTAVKCAIALIWGKNAFRKSTTLGFVCILSGLALSLVFIRQ